MTGRSIFFCVLLMIFIGTMAVGLTLLFKDHTKDAMEVFGGGLFAGVFLLIIGLPIIWDDL